MGLNYIYDEAKRAEKTSSNSSNYSCTFKRTYGLLYADLISKRVKIDRLICMDEVYSLWKSLQINDDGVAKERKSSISIMTKLEFIQDRFLKGGDNMKLHIKEQMRKISYLETTDLNLSTKSIKSKGAPKKVKLTPSDNSSKRSPSYFKHVDTLFPYSPISQSKRNYFKFVNISIPSPSQPLPQSEHLQKTNIFKRFQLLCTNILNRL